MDAHMTDVSYTFVLRRRNGVDTARSVRCPMNGKEGPTLVTPCNTQSSQTLDIVTISTSASTMSSGVVRVGLV